MVWFRGHFLSQLSLFGVAQTVFLVNRVFVPCQKGAFFLFENRENDEFAFYLLKTRASLFRPPKTTKMAGVTQAKAWLFKSQVCSSLNCSGGFFHSTPGSAQLSGFPRSCSKSAKNARNKGRVNREVQTMN